MQTKGIKEKFRLFPQIVENTVKPRNLFEDRKVEKFRIQMFQLLLRSCL